MRDYVGLFNEAPIIGFGPITTPLREILDRPAPLREVLQSVKEFSGRFILQYSDSRRSSPILAKLCNFGPYNVRSARRTLDQSTRQG